MKTFMQILRESQSVDFEDIVDQLQWIPVQKAPNMIHGMYPSQRRNFENKFEKSKYSVGPEDGKIILKGNQGELWANDIIKVCKTYEVTPQDFENNPDEWLELVTKPGAYFAAHVDPNYVIKLMGYGGTTEMLANSNGGSGDYVLCNPGSDGEPNLSDIWVVKDDVFAKTYEERNG